MIVALQDVLRNRPSWRELFVWYLRALAILLIGAGLIHWARIIGYTPWRGVFFADMQVEWQVATVYFGVLDLVAAVGLWLTASWGPVMWLLRTLSQVAMHTVFADIFAHRPYEISFYLITILIYLGLLVLMERENRR
ncbi:DUF6163 family protein [Breoghania sp. L-A4]|uniref:DUF6163 family protein n=1 Tax=Breoghania sp. L-A4 TaxID=2304600 RepID=UPI000E35F657|nr:DUF6163 family protein [Breoghania sp. L-A4]AXS40258.1 hypothetical protein D1F64_09530 [Breoghania sp. L-A4]